MRTLPFSLPGFELQQVSCGETALTITARSINPEAPCPSCQQVSHRVHSYYIRSPQDLPVSGQSVQLLLHVRRFRCQNRQCQRKTFAERLPEVVPVQARRTNRLGTLLDLMAIALSGQAGSQLTCAGYIGYPFAKTALKSAGVVFKPTLYTRISHVASTGQSGQCQSG